MRSYNYHNGVWKLCKDPLPREATSSDFGSLDPDNPQLLSDGYASIAKTYRTALDRLGFPDKSELFQCQSGKLEVYTRDHVKLGGDRKERDFPYDFLCILRFNGSYIRVWVDDMPSLFLFLREVEAHRDNTSMLDRLFKEAELQELIFSMRYAMDALQAGDLEITVKHPKQPER